MLDGQGNAPRIYSVRTTPSRNILRVLCCFLSSTEAQDRIPSRKEFSGGGRRGLLQLWSASRGLTPRSFFVRSENEQQNISLSNCEGAAVLGYGLLLD